MNLTGLHILLTYQCTLECDHCFVWGSPWQSGTFTLDRICEALDQAKDLGTVEWIYFEGGEPFLYYAALVKGVQEAAGRGFQVGVVTNGYWATGLGDALECLRPLAGLVRDLSVSSDLYHWDAEVSRQAQNARQAAERLGIPVGMISIAQPEAGNSPPTAGQLPTGQSAVMYRGRAAEKLASRAVLKPWEQFTACPYEDLREPGRVHLDPLGNIHICQGISLGNVFDTPLGVICATYQPDSHPIAGPLLEGGPLELSQRYETPLDAAYADACHLCYETRLALRERFPEILAPDAMYGAFAG